MNILISALFGPPHINRLHFKRQWQWKQQRQWRCSSSNMDEASSGGWKLLIDGVLPNALQLCELIDCSFDLSGWDRNNFHQSSVKFIRQQPLAMAVMTLSPHPIFTTVLPEKLDVFPFYVLHRKKLSTKWWTKSLDPPLTVKDVAQTLK